MAGVDVQMDYQQMQQMVQIFRQGAQQLSETMRAIQNVAGILEQGALLGKGGDLLAEALRNRFVARLTRLHAKFEELAGDCQQAIRFVYEGDTSARGRFN